MKQELRSANRRHDRHRFFKYMTLEAGLAVLGSRTLRWSSPRRFNDPFDVPRNLEFPFTREELLRGMGAALIQMVENPSPDPKASALVKQLRSAGNPDLLNLTAQVLSHPHGPMATVLEYGLEESRQAWQDHVANLRILCLSEIPDSPVLWSHYADTHRGLVLELAAVDELDSALLLAGPVVYQHEPPSLPSTQYWSAILTDESNVDWEEVFAQYYRVKATQWSYEKEWRAVTVSLNNEPEGYTDLPFHPLELRRIYVGPGMSDEAIAAVLAALTSSDFGHVELCRASHDHRSRTISLLEVVRPGSTEPE